MAFAASPQAASGFGFAEAAMAVAASGRSRSRGVVEAIRLNVKRLAVVGDVDGTVEHGARGVAELRGIERRGIVRENEAPYFGLRCHFGSFACRRMAPWGLALFFG